MKNRLLPAALAALLLIYLQLRSGIDSHVAVVLATTALAYVVIASGRLLLAAAGGRVSSPAAAWVLGLLASCLAIYVLTAVFPLTAAAAFGVVAAAVVALEVALARKVREPPPDWRALTGFALCIAFTAAWCSGPAGAYEVLRTQDVLPVWSDYFFHSGLISQFGDGRALGRGSIHLADFPPAFYHFGSYAPAAALAGMLDQPGLPLATSAWLPLGFLAMLAGAYALGERLAGVAGGVAALAAVAILPDASNYGLRNGLFSFHWMMLSHPGAPYALGAAFMSLAFLDRWSAERSRAALAASALLAVSIILFRAHVFVLYFPAWFATAAFCCAPQASRKRLIALLLMAALGAAAVGASLGLAQLASTDPDYWRFRGPALGAFLAEMHQAQEPTAYTGIYADLASEDAPGFTLAAGIVLVVVAALGAFVALLPAAMSLARHFAALRPIDAFPAYLAFCWLLLMLFAPVPWHEDSTNLIFQPFVLVYAAAAVWTLCLLLRSLAARADRVASRLWPAMLAGAALALPAIAAGAETLAHPKFSWGQKDAAPRLEPGLVQAAAFLRKQAPVGDIFAAAGLTAERALFDLSTELCALSGMPAYLSRPYLEMLKGSPRKAVASARLAALQQVDRETDYGSAMRALQRLGVQWYVVAGKEGPPWDPRRERAAFSAGTTAVYPTRPAGSGGAFHDEMGVRNANQVVPHEAAHLAELGSREPLVRRTLAHMPPAVE